MERTGPPCHVAGIKVCCDYSGTFLKPVAFINQYFYRVLVRVTAFVENNGSDAVESYAVVLKCNGKEMARKDCENLASDNTAAVTFELNRVLVIISRTEHIKLHHRMRHLRKIKLTDIKFGSGTGAFIGNGVETTVTVR